PSYREKLTTLRYCSQAGGHMSRAIKDGLRQVLPTHTQIFVMYGATEAAARLSYLEPERYTEKMDSIGKAIPGVTLRVLDSTCKELPPNQVGELVASGTNIMHGYWQDPASTSKALKDGWYYTGDQAYKDEEGYFYVVGRKDDQLKVGGHRVNTLEIEDTLMESGLLVETVVLGVPDALLGHKLIACTVPKSSAFSEGKILAACAEQLPKYKIPGGILLVRSLPKNSSGKIDRTKCFQLLMDNISKWS
ncbi:MAG: class I adenylate-forming enzyme family protein, partial [Smithellaceae bacterium]